MLSRGRGYDGLGRVRSTLHRPQAVVLCCVLRTENVFVCCGCVQPCVRSTQGGNPCCNCTRNNSHPLTSARLKPSACARIHPQQLASSYFGPAKAERLREYISSWWADLVQNLFLPLSAWETRSCECPYVPPPLWSSPLRSHPNSPVHMFARLPALSISARSPARRWNTAQENSTLLVIL